MKQCTKCKEQLPDASFGKSRGWCRNCKNASNRSRYANATIEEKRRLNGFSTPAGKRCRRRKKIERYGITEDQYRELLIAQDGLCGCCGRPETRSVKGVLATLSIDHDHETGVVRGLLCSSCNWAIGRLGDDLEGLKKAVVYLERSRLPS